MHKLKRNKVFKNNMNVSTFVSYLSMALLQLGVVENDRWMFSMIFF